ncbi:hypothetical protein RHMOL_Rhmol02G0015800 [Rhododendron molle]|uniref:Uncharacterized protein n=1 Tax=Rhododendron molle TaxID=49168 RepID=A0ACC0PKA9_RHOML|nr:hypothetical protein RHMOL_Rhmol02G0015800 [Rhododendron molle]
MSPKEPQTLLLLPLSSSCSSFTQMAIGNGYQENTVTEDLENPLLTEHEKVDESKKGGEKGSIGMVLLSTAVATCGSFEFGLCVGYSAPTQPAIREDLHLSLAEYSVFGSIVAVGAMAGAITSGKISDSIGRKWGMRLSAGCCIVGWLAIYFSMGALVLDMGRFLTGCGIGVFSSVVPVFIAEIAPTNLRGGLTTLNQAKTGKHREFEAALRKLRGEDADVSREEAEIQTYIETLRSLPISQTLDLLDAKYVRSVTVGLSGNARTTAYAIIQIFPIHLMGIAGSLVTLVSWFGTWAVSYTFNFLMSWSSTGTFFVYAAFSAQTVLFVAKMVPETKGKTLEEIQVSINTQGRIKL